MYPPTVLAAASQGALVESFFGLYFFVFSIFRGPTQWLFVSPLRASNRLIYLYESRQDTFSYRIWEHRALRAML
ncbi:MAG: hypothetical protein EOP10_20615 [Proteobacteria bacterium]|nr:MAG: hypothetical protein EOP10_20615 [Pseudomonadota bacterium]